ncbi:cytochrome P450 6j1-like [Trichogramma pretiosum]|uniref:cytochrome P450 6j1-like n=1 Tax=Trichogramma pretiosum TaxID=7493 RepID=UPI0006C9471E|nr:cytochrome P450 6j1-like [Trichogramma pretiosum]
MDLFYSIGLFVIIFIGILYYSATTFDFWTRQGIYTDRNLIPIFGNALPVLLMRKNLSMLCNEACKNLSSNYSLIGMFFMQTPLLVIRDPELIKNVLIKHFNYFRNNALYVNDRDDPFMVKNPFFAVDESWKQNRAYLVSKMSPKKLKTLFLIISDISIKFKNYLKELLKNEGSNIVELKTIIMKFTGEIVANTAFGIEGQGFNKDRDPDCFTVKLEHFLQPTYLSGVKETIRFYFPNLASFLRIGFLPMKLSIFLLKTIEDVFNYRVKKHIVINDLLQMAIESTDNPNLEVVSAHVSAYFFDAYETSATIASFACYNLAYYPDIQEKTRKHIEKVLNDHDFRLSIEALRDMFYLDQVINETIRLHPILGINIRSCNQDISLQSSDGQNVHIKSGNLLCIPVQSIHTDEKYWKNPFVFDPDRFSEDRKKEIVKFTFLPFGEGPRICAGKNYGIMIVKVALIIILRDFIIKGLQEKMPAMTYDHRSFLTASKDGLQVHLIKR